MYSFMLVLDSRLQVNGCTAQSCGLTDGAEISVVCWHSFSVVVESPNDADASDIVS